MIQRNNRCCNNGQNDLFREMLGCTRYQPVYEVKYRPNKGNGIKNPTVLREIKRSFSTQKYSTIYPTGSCHGKFYGTAEVYSKVRKLPENRTINQ